MISSVHRFDPDATRVAVGAVVLLAATVAGAWIAWPVFLAVGVVALGLVAYSAHRWPLPTLVVSALFVLFDTVLLRTVLPASIEIGPIGASEPLLAVTGLVIAVTAIRRGTFWSALADPLLWLMALFVVVAIVSALVNGTPPRVALIGIVMTVDAIAVYFIARMVPTTERQATGAITAVVAVALFAAIIGILQVVLHPDLLGLASFAGRFGEGGRITSFLGNPNMVAAVVGFTLPFPLFASRHFVTPRGRWVAFGTLVTFCVALLLTFSRGAWLAVVVGLVVSLLVLDWRALRTLVVAIAVAWAVTIVMPRNLLIAEADLPLYFPESGAPSIIDSTIDRLDEVYERRDLRMRFIREGIPIVLDNPWLGVGPGRYGGAASAIFPSPVYEEYDAGLYGFRTIHNFWLHLFGEVGLIGGLVFVVAIFMLWLRFVRAALAEVDPRRRILLAGTAAAISVVTVNNMTEMVFEGNFPGFVVWMVVGIVSLLAPPLRVFGRARDPVSGSARETTPDPGGSQAR